MLKFMYDHKGSLSLFTLFLLIPIMVFSGVLMDLARAKAIEAQSAATAETYANSYLSVYDEMLNELYGLFAVTQDKDGLEAVRQLEEYMKASFKPKSKDDTGLENSFLIGMLRQNYSDALSLTGSALSDLQAVAGKPLVNGNNYDALQMQISEYVKFIGPTDVLTSTLKLLLQPNSRFDSEKSENEVQETNKNFKRIKKKNEIDNLISDLNNQIKDFFNAMKVYDETIDNYYNSSGDIAGVHTFTLEEVNSYRHALDTAENAVEELERVIGEIENEQTEFEEENTPMEEPDNNSDNDTNTASNVPQADPVPEPPKFKISNMLANEIRNIIEPDTRVSVFTDNMGNVGSCFDYYDLADRIKKGEAVNYGIFSGHVQEYYLNADGVTQSNMDYSAAHVRSRRETVVRKANEFNASLNLIRTKLTNLIDEIQCDIDNPATSEEERTDTQKFLDGIKKDYKDILDADGTKPTNSTERKMWVIANFNYSDFAVDFNSYAERCEGDIRERLQEFLDVNTGITKADTFLNEIYDGVAGYVAMLVGDNLSYDQEIDYDSIIPDAKRWVNEKLTECRNYSRPDEDDYEITEFRLDYFYTKLEDNESQNESGITHKELYNAMDGWYNKTEEQEQEENKINGISDSIWDAIKTMEFNNIKLRKGCENKILPGAASSDSDSNAEKQDLKDILDNDDNELPPTDLGAAFINKLLIILYDYGMFTCQTSDKIEDENDLVITKKPLSYQGITLAVQEKDGEKYKYETSDTNFLLYGELEYIFNGDRDPEKNMHAVRNSLAVIRFVPNYISTYTISEINTIVNTVQTALAWCPPAAIIAAQALRIAIASFETWCDLDLLYGGSSVLLYKKSMSDVSFVEKMKLHCKEAYATLSEYDKNGSMDKTNGSDSNGLKVNYTQYLVLLEMIFVPREKMIERTADLIEANMNYVIDGDCDGDDGKKTVKIESFKLSEAKTSVTVTCEVKRDFVFTGGVFNVRDSGYDDAAEFADKMNAEGNVYKCTITREY